MNEQNTSEVVKEIITHPQRTASQITTWFVDELRWTCRVIISSADRFYWDNGFSRAASLAYTTILSLVPIMALFFGILASFADWSKYVPEAREFILKQFIPSTAAADQVLEYLNGWSNNLSSMNVLAVAFLVITSILLINSIEYALNEIWQVFEPRKISDRIMIFCSIILIAPILTISAFYFTKKEIEPFIQTAAIWTYIDSAYILLFPLLIDFLAFLSLYYLVPKAPVKFSAACFGSLFAALLFGLAKTLFVIYVERYASYASVYAALAAIPIFLTWLYLAWVIVLFGAETSYQAQYLPRKGKLWKRSILSVGDGMMLLTIQALVIVARAFHSGTKLPNELELAEALGCSIVVIKPGISALERAGIIGRGDSRDQPITLLRSPSKIFLEDIRDALFSTRICLSYSEEMMRLFDFARDRSQLKVRSLADVAGLPSPDSEK